MNWRAVVIACLAAFSGACTATAPVAAPGASLKTAAAPTAHQQSAGATPVPAQSGTTADDQGQQRASRAAPVMARAAVPVGVAFVTAALSESWTTPYASWQHRVAATVDHEFWTKPEPVPPSTFSADALTAQRVITRIRIIDAHVDADAPNTATTVYIDIDADQTVTTRAASGVVHVTAHVVATRGAAGWRITRVVTYA